MHRYMDVTYQGNAGAIAEEQITARPSLDIFAPPSMALCDIPSFPGAVAHGCAVYEPKDGHKKSNVLRLLYITELS